MIDSFNSNCNYEKVFHCVELGFEMIMGKESMLLTMLLGSVVVILKKINISYVHNFALEKLKIEGERNVKDLITVDLCAAETVIFFILY